VADDSFAPPASSHHTARGANIAQAVRVLRATLIAQWALALASLLLFEVESPQLPPELQGYALDHAIRPAAGGDVGIGVFAAVWLVASLVASAGVFFLVHWSRLPYLATGLLGCLLMALLEPAVTSRWSTAADTLVHLLVGFAICLVYWSPAAAAFARRDA
jgi:hypothetical protein